MKIDQCPKNMKNCPESICPMYPCWAYEKHAGGKDRQQKAKDQGWE
jgi:hypothetical protein